MCLRVRRSETHSITNRSPDERGAGSEGEQYQHTQTARQSSDNGNQKSPANPDEQWWHGPYDIRFLHSHTWPKIVLRYTLKDGGQTVRSAEETLSDLSYQLNVIGPSRASDVMPYEKAMLARWFQSRFAAD